MYFNYFFLTYNTTRYMCSYTVLSYYVYVYHTFSSCASISSSTAQAFTCSLSVDFKSNTNMGSDTRHFTVHQQEYLQNNYHDHYADSYRFIRGAFWKSHHTLNIFLCNQELNSRNLVFYNVAVFPKFAPINLFFALVLSSSQEALAVSYF